jgi:hypothetical protein
MPCDDRDAACASPAGVMLGAVVIMSDALVQEGSMRQCIGRASPEASEAGQRLAIIR